MSSSTGCVFEAGRRVVRSNVRCSEFIRSNSLLLSGSVDFKEPCVLGARNYVRSN